MAETTEDTTTTAESEAGKRAESASENAPKVTFVTVLRNAGFRNLWLGQIISQVGDYFTFLATLVVVSGFSVDAQSTTLAVSGMMIAQTLPRLIFGLLSGVFVDRWDRRRTMIASDAIRTLLSLAFIPAFLSQNLLAMYAIGFALSTVGTLFNPAKSALIQTLVPKDQLLSANSLSQTSMVLAMLLGPVLAGLTLSAVGPANTWIAFVVDSLSYVISAFAILLIVVPRAEKTERAPETPDAGAVRKVWNEVVVGLKALFLNRTVATVSVVFMVTMLGVGAINVLWVTWLKTGFGFQSSELAWRIAVIDTAFSLGMIVSTVGVGNFLSNSAPKWFIVWGLAGTGITIAVCGYVQDYWALVGVMLICGLSVAPGQTAASTLVQIVVPNSQMGRVSGGLQTVIDTATLLSMSLAGALGAAVGIPAVFLIGGVLCLAAGLVAWAFLPALTFKDKVLEPEQPASPQEMAFPEREAVA